ncbi:MAG TPA: PIG-L family deacetylase [Saprospiraceae bacterium]|nr:PIG-L family deacetylase [Saprospiraceae bacterium]
MSVSSRLLCLPLLLLAALLSAQKPAKPSAADLHQAIKKLNVLGSVLYVAAHPDDENQRFISYCANHKLFNVTYLSLTRGDGGQNLIGPEIRELLGVLRTEELLMARSIDGGKQWFSRANDFGFSKNPEETMRIWDKDKVLGDVVWAMRLTQPDVVVNRFYHDKKYDTHGHHTASGMLSVEAFDLAGRADAYPEQLAYSSVWQPRRQFFNTSWFFFGGQEAFDKMDKSHLFSLDVGVYLPLKGKSNNEVSAEARSMHRCQGFGNMSARGETKDWFDFIKGERPKTQDIFEGINTTWTRVAGGEKIGKLLARIDAQYRSDAPAASLPELLKAQEMIKALPDGYWKRIKLAEIREVIKGCLGLYLEATAAEPTATHGDQVKIRLEAIQRSPADAGMQVVLSGVSVAPGLFDTVPAAPLEPNKGWVLSRSVRIPADAPFTAPYWLQSASNLGMYTVEDQRLRGKPETERFARVRWSLTLNGVPLEYETDVAFKETEPAIGEVWRPFEVLPAAFVEFGESAYIFSENERDVTLRVKSGRGKMSGSVRLIAPAGWTVSPASAPVEFARKGEEKTLGFRVQAPAHSAEAQLSAAVQVEGQDYNLRLATIKYDHIPQQSVLMPATVHAARLDLKVKAKQVGYLMGAGDEVPAALRQMGCRVSLLEIKDLGDADNLSKYQAIVVGVRAYNTKDDLKFAQANLLDYVEKGGTLVLQYNTTGDLVTDRLAPYPLKLSRTRTTDEAAEMRFRLPEHPVLNSPNKITSADFSGWVQERGLYFPGEWDAQFEAPLSCNDPDEKPADGSLLVARYGKGHYVYTGLSFFRELPAGVPGAYRLFANLISLGL